MSNSRVFLTILLTTCITVQPVLAADKKDKAAREAQRRMALMKQQMEAEKAELQAAFDKQKAELEAKLQDTEKSAIAARGSLAAAKRRNTELEGLIETLRMEKLEVESAKLKTDTSLTETRDQLEATRKTLAEAQRDLKINESQRKEISKSLVQRDTSLAACTEKNERLHTFGLELVKIYDKPSLYEAVLRTEPFAQIKRVELENILQGYRDKLDEQRVTTIKK